MVAIHEVEAQIHKLEYGFEAKIKPYCESLKVFRKINKEMRK